MSTAEHNKKLTIYTAGAAQDSPGRAGIGLVIQEPDGTEELFSENIDIATLEQAQYQAIIRAVQIALEKNYSHLVLYLDNPSILTNLLSSQSVDDLKTNVFHNQVLELCKNITVDFNLYCDFNNRVTELAEGASLRPVGNENTNDKRKAIQQSAGGVLYKKEGKQIKVCLIAKKGGQVWALPKGRLNAGETWEETAIREVLEETGHLATISECINQIDYFFYWKENHTLYYKVVSFFLMPLVCENFGQRDGEADAVNWFTIGEAWKKLYYQSEKDILRQAQRILKTASI